LETIHKSKEYGDMEEIKLLEVKIIEEIQKDNILPLEDLEMQKIVRLNAWLESGKSDFRKMKVRFYSKNYRGVHASRNIKVIFLYYLDCFLKFFLIFY